MYLLPKPHLKVQELLNFTRCKYNQLFINYDKTHLMFITNRHKIVQPKTIIMNNKEINVVQDFKLLGVTIDNKLNFNKYVSEVKKKIYCKLYSIKRLYQLSFDDRLQFFKTFVLPHFDYCLSLCIYKNKQTFSRFGRMYYKCIKLLFSINLTLSDIIDTNRILSVYNLFSYQHRILYRLLLFIYKIKNDSLAPKQLKFYLETTKKGTSQMVLRPRKAIPLDLVKNRNGEKTFFIFAKKLINCLDLLPYFSLSFKEFKSTILNDFNKNNLFIHNFVNLFNKFYFTFDYSFL
jgi:hypothetical protein